MVTIKDVAERAGVSISTVSNVLNKKGNVSVQLSELVESVAQELNYHVNTVARNMKAKSSKTVGIIVGTIKSVFVNELIDGIHSVMSARDYKLLFYSSDFDPQTEKKCIEMLISSMVDGIILDSVVPSDDADYFCYLKSLSNGDRPVTVVSVERNLTQYGIHSVFTNNIHGSEIATQHLFDQGCNNIALITGPTYTDLVIDRIKGYKNTLYKNNRDFIPELMACGNFSASSGYEAALSLMASAVTFDGIYACNDQMAIGAMQALLNFGKCIPEDVKIIGFDNIFVTTIVSPAMSTINVPKVRMGFTAAKCLLDIIEGCADEKITCFEMPINIEIRGTTQKGITTRWELEHW